MRRDTFGADTRVFDADSVPTTDETLCMFQWSAGASIRVSRVSVSYLLTDADAAETAGRVVVFTGTPSGGLPALALKALEPDLTQYGITVLRDMVGLVSGELHALELDALPTAGAPLYILAMWPYSPTDAVFVDAVVALNVDGERVPQGSGGDMFGGRRTRPA